MAAKKQSPEPYSLEIDIRDSISLWGFDPKEFLGMITNVRLRELRDLIDAELKSRSSDA